MFMRRPAVVRRRPGLLGTMARTAVVAGTATATVGAINHHQQAKAMAQANELAEDQQISDMQQQLNDLQTQQVAAAVQPAASMPASQQGDLMQQLQQLADMKAQGVLTDEEFAAFKAKLLGA